LTVSIKRGRIVSIIREGAGDVANFITIASVAGVVGTVIAESAKGIGGFFRSFFD
jgi:hypothetical protein